MNRNIATTACLVFLLFFVSTTPLLAQNQVQLEDIGNDDVNRELTQSEEEDLFNENRPADINDTSKLRATFVENIQRPSDKVIRYELVLTTAVSSDRVKVTWETLGIVDIVNPNQLENTVTVQAGNTYRFPLDVRPTGQGVSEIKGIAELFEADARSLAFVRKNFASNANGEVLPLSDNYNAAKLRYQSFVLLRNGVLLTLVIAGGYFGSKKFISWYKTD